MAEKAPRATNAGPDLYLERGIQILDNAERKPLLYDANGKPLMREVGFRG